MSQLTQNIAGAYINAQVEREGIIEPLLDACSFHLSEYKLILTPLSAISDEDAVEVAKMAIGDEAKLQKIVREGRIFVTMEYGVNVDTCVIVPPAKQHEYGRECFYIYITNESKYIISSFGTSRITDYLRSRNYDIGYMGIKSLIDAGIAISSLDKTETK